MSVGRSAALGLAMMLACHLLAFATTLWLDNASGPLVVGRPVRALLGLAQVVYVAPVLVVVAWKLGRWGVAGALVPALALLALSLVVLG